MITGALYVDRGFSFRETLDGAALRESLAAEVRRYQPLSGRLEQDADGGFSAVRNDAGPVSTRHHQGTRDDGRGAAVPPAG